jgi:hypothetical protein
LISACTRDYTVSMNALFDHETLTVYQDAIRFVVWAGERLVGASISKSLSGSGSNEEEIDPDPDSDLDEAKPQQGAAPAAAGASSVER